MDIGNKVGASRTRLADAAQARPPGTKWGRPVRPAVREVWIKAMRVPLSKLIKSRVLTGVSVVDGNPIVFVRWA